MDTARADRQAEPVRRALAEMDRVVETHEEALGLGRYEIRLENGQYLGSSWGPDRLVARSETRSSPGFGI